MEFALLVVLTPIWSILKLSDLLWYPTFGFSVHDPCKKQIYFHVCYALGTLWPENVLGYACNHCSPSGNETLCPLGGKVGNAASMTGVWSKCEQNANPICPHGPLNQFKRAPAEYFTNLVVWGDVNRQTWRHGNGSWANLDGQARPSCRAAQTTESGLSTYNPSRRPLRRLLLKDHSKGSGHWAST